MPSVTRVGSNTRSSPSSVGAVTSSVPTTTHEYDLIKLVALSLIVGSAGPAFLATAQSRVMSALNAQRADTAVQTGKTQVDQVEESAKAAVPGAVQEAIMQQFPNADSATVKAATDTATASLERALAPQVEVARQQMDAVTRPSR